MERIDGSIETLAEHGLSPAEAERWSRLLKQWTSIDDPLLRWTKITSELLSPNVPFALHEWLYRRNYQTRQAQGLPCPAWVPSGEDIEQSHVGQWMRRHGFDRFEDLHEWSVTQVEAFGDAVTKALSIRFAQFPVAENFRRAVVASSADVAAADRVDLVEQFELGVSAIGHIATVGLQHRSKYGFLVIFAFRLCWRRVDSFRNSA